MARSDKRETRLADRVRGRYSLAYLLLFGLALVAGLASWPILAADTDLWYHLNAGRYIAAGHGIPSAAFFSFLRPTPAWLDYYWLTQLLFYRVHSLAGYLGLVELRALVAVGTYGFVLATLRLGKGSEGWGYTAFIFSLTALFFLGRLAIVRPCDLSYLSIAAFLWVLEARRGLLALPLLAVLWVNLHGIEYPVMLLILGAYLGEWTLARAGAPANVTAPPWRAFACVALAMVAVLATPHGLTLIRAPFTPLLFASQYIQELAPVDLSGLLSLRVDGLTVSRPSFLALLCAVSALAALASLRRASWRPAHLVLFAGGVFLLARAMRFSAEFVLLAVPLLAAFRPRLSALPVLPVVVRAALGLALAFVPFWLLYSELATRCTFPLCTRGLPEGSVAFLDRVGATGTVLNHPNDGGYLEWELQPRQLIFADLQTPFLFSDRDIFVADQAFQDSTVFAGLVAAYHPDFLIVPKKLRGFGSWVGQVADFAPVFVDDASVLYASAVSQADLVARHRLTAFEPFTLEIAGDRANPETLARAAAELARANEIYPAGGRLHVFEGALALQRGDLDLAQRIADDAVRLHPDRPEGQRLRGDVALRREHFAEAAAAYEAALARGDDSPGGSQTFYLQSRLWACYSRLGKHDAAYRALRDALGDLYTASVGYRELASLASAALDAGREAEGRSLIEFALAKTPAGEAELRRTLEARLRSLAAVR
ncbi:MAG: hypothetical protein ACHQ6T_16495 [Myxococcota bacterium]